jgi:hypothetical protein
MDEILVQGLKGERKAWRTSLIFIKLQLAAVKKGKEIDSNANAMLAAVRNSSGLRKECPYHLPLAVQKKRKFSEERLVGGRSSKRKKADKL